MIDSPYDHNAMADRIVALEERLKHLACARCHEVNPAEVHTCTPAPKVTVLDEWRVYARDGVAYSIFYSVNADTSKQADEKWPSDAPHTVRRVALIDDNNGEIK